MENKTLKYGLISLILIALIIVFIFNNGGADSGAYLLMGVLFFPLTAFLILVIFNKRNDNKSKKSSRSEGTYHSDLALQQLKTANSMYNARQYRSAKEEYQKLLKYYYGSFTDSTLNMIKKKIESCSDHLTEGINK